MSAITYTYSVSQDCRDGEIVPQAVHRAIVDSVIASVLQSVSVDNDVCTIVFDTALSVDDKARLDALLLNTVMRETYSDHYAVPAWMVTGDDTFQSSATQYVIIPDMNCTISANGTYWANMTTSIEVNKSNVLVEMAFFINDTQVALTPISYVKNNSSAISSVAVHAWVDLVVGDVLTVRVRSSSSKSTLTVYERNMALLRINPITV